MGATGSTQVGDGSHLDTKTGSAHATLTVIEPSITVNIPEPRTSFNTQFEIFWKSYPKKKSKGDARKAFIKIKPNEQLFAAMLRAVEKSNQSEQWTKDGGNFIPYPATWLNKERWLDEDEDAENCKFAWDGAK